MTDRWMVQVTGNDNLEKSLSFQTKREAEEFISERVDMVRHLGYDPDETYYLIPIQ
tara:strand:- start:779 stop:946 length:168 start_codon:yes stop_codon:yes gene_type:complete